MDRFAVVNQNVLNDWAYVMKRECVPKLNGLFRALLDEKRLQENSYSMKSYQVDNNGLIKSITFNNENMDDEEVELDNYYMKSEKKRKIKVEDFSGSTLGSPYRHSHA